MAKLKSGTRIYGSATVDAGLTIASINASGIITASSYRGDGSQLTGISGGGGSLTVQEEGSSLGTATVLNFIGSGVTATLAGGTANISISATGGGGGGSVTISDDTTTNASRFIAFQDTTSGTASSLYVSSTKLTFNPSTGNLVAAGTVTANSDENLKTNIETISDALGKVLSLRGVEYDRIDNGEHQIGVIAQEVEKVIPDIVYPKGPAPDYEVKSVAYGNLVALLIEAIKEQNLRIDELEKKLKEI